ELELVRMVREQQPLRPGLPERGDRLLGRQMAARLAVEVPVRERRLAEEDVGSPCELDEALARRGVARVGERAPLVADSEAVRLQLVVREPDRGHGQPARSERDAVLVLPDDEGPLEHVGEAEALAEIREVVAAARQQPELRLRRLAAEPVHRAPDPRDEVAPMVEVEVGDHDGVDLRPAFPLTEAREDAGAAVEQHASWPFDEVAGVRSAGVGPGRGAADDAQFHPPILTAPWATGSG